MAQSSLYPAPPEKLASPVAKRSRLSLKQNRPLLQDSPLSPACLEPNSETVSKNVCEAENCESGQTCSIQDENASPNCSFVQSKLAPLAVPELMDDSHRVFALGLPNCGNTCYINSILQVLRYTPNFLNCIHLILFSQKQLSQVSCCPTETLKESEFFIKLHALFIAMKRQELLLKTVEKEMAVSLLRPVKSFLLSLREVSSLFEEGEQHDAHELLLTIVSTFSSFYQSIKNKISAYIDINHPRDNESSETSSPESLYGNLSNLQEKEQKKNKARFKRRQKLKSLMKFNKLLPQTPLNFNHMEGMELGFEGKIRHCIKCLECEKRLERIELFTNLEVPIADSLIFEDTIDLVQCLCQTTELNGENKYFCDDCYHLTEARISSEIVLSPSILLLHCSWLKQSSDISEAEKDCTKVLIPMRLKTLDNTDIFCCPEDETYNLYAVVLHLGKTTEGGHYVSFVKDTSPKILPDIMKNLNITRNTNNAELCCATEEIVNFKLLSTTVNRWLLFDDENVSAVYVNESSETFPYYDFLGITATPCMIFYFKT